MEKILKISLDSTQVKTALEALKPPMDRTSEAFERMSRESKNFGRQVTENMGGNTRQSVNDLQESFKRMQERTKQMSNSVATDFEKMRNAAKNAADQTVGSFSTMEKASDSLLKKVTGLAGALAGGFGFVALLKNATEVEKSVYQVAGALGKTTEEAKGFAAIANEVYTGAWGESLKETSEAVIRVKQSFSELGVTSQQEIKSITQDVLTLSNTYNSDYRKNINAASILMEKFGLSSQQSLDFISAGYQRGLDASGDFTDSITEYATQFANGGASAEQFFSLLETGYSAGYLSSDKAADAFKEFRLRIQDGSKTTADALALIGINSDELVKKLGDGSLTVADAFQQVTQVINETEDSTIRMQAGTGLLGTQFEDLGDKAVRNLDLTAVKMSDLEGAMARTNKINESLSASWTSFTRTLINSISSSDAFQSSLSILSKSLIYLNDNMDSIVNAGTMIAEIIGAGGLIFVGMKAITGVMALATAGTTAFSTAAMRLSATAATGAGSVAMMNTSLYGTSVAAQTAGSSLAKLQVAGQAVFAGFIGWELGSYFYNEFESVRQYAYSFVGQIEENFLSIQYYTQVTTEIFKGTFQEATDFVSDKIASGFAAAQQSILNLQSAFTIVSASGQRIIADLVSWVMDSFGSMVSGLATAMSYADFIPGLDKASAGLNSFSASIKSSSDSIKNMGLAASESINETAQAYVKQSEAITKNKEAIQSAGGSKLQEELSKLSTEFEKNKQNIRDNINDLHAFTATQNTVAVSSNNAAKAIKAESVENKGNVEALKMLSDAEKNAIINKKQIADEEKAAKKALREQEKAAKKAQSEENKQEKEQIDQLKKALNEQAKEIDNTAKGYREAAKALDEHINGLKVYHSALTDAQTALVTSGMTDYEKELYTNVKELGTEYGSQITTVENLAKAQSELLSIQLEQKKVAIESNLQGLRLQGVSQEDIDREVKYQQLRIELSQQYTEKVVEELVQQQRLTDASKEQIEIQKRLADSQQLLSESVLNDKQREYVKLMREVGVENAKVIIQNQEMANARSKGDSTLAALQEEHKLLQMTSEEQKRYNAIKEAAPDQRDAIVQQMELNETLKATKDRLDEAGKIAGNYFEKFVSGSISGKEALKGMANEISAFASKELFKAARDQLQNLTGKKSNEQLVGDTIDQNLVKATEWFDKNTAKVVSSSKDFSGTIAKAVDDAGNKLSRSIDGFAKQINEAIVKQKSYEQQADALEKASQAMKDSANQIGEAAKNIGEGSSAIGNFVSSGSRRLGFLSEKYEVGRGGAGTISTGIGDKGGKSYGSWQLASKVGTLSTFVNSKEASPFASMLKSAKLASSEFDKIWKNLAKNQEKAFESAQHAFIKRTHYDPAAKYASSKGFDMSNEAIQNAIWSGSVQHGGIKKIIANVAKYHQSALNDVDSTLKAFYEERTKYAAKHHKGLQKRYQSEEKDALAYASILKKGGAAVSKSVQTIDKAISSAKPPVEKISSTSKTLADTQTRAVNIQKDMSQKVQDIQQQKIEVEQKDLVSNVSHNQAMDAINAQRQTATMKDAEIIVVLAQATEQGAAVIANAASMTPTISPISSGGIVPTQEGGFLGNITGALSGMFQKGTFEEGGLLGNAKSLFGLDKIMGEGGGLGDIFSGGLGDITQNLGGITGSIGGMEALGIGMDLLNGKFENAAVDAAALAASMTPLGPLGGAAVKTFASLAGVGAEWVRESEWTIAEIKGTVGKFSKGFKEVKDGILGGEKYGEEALDDSRVKALEEFLGQTTEIIENTIERISGANKKIDSVLEETRAYISGMGAHDEEWFNEQMMQSRVRAIKDYVSNIMIVGIDDATNQTQTEAVANSVAPKITSIMDQVVKGTFDKAIRASSWSGDLDFGELSGRHDISADEMKSKLEQGINDYIKATDFSGMDTVMLTENIGSKLQETFSNLGVNDIPQETFDDMANIIGGRIQNSLEFISTGIGEFVVKDDAKFYQTFKNMTSAFEGTDEELSRFVDGMLNLKDTFKLGGLSTDSISEKFIDAAGGFEKLSEKANIFKEKFISETESQSFAVQNVLSGITDAIDATNVILPATREGFTDLVRGLSNAGEDSEEALAKLISTSDQFDIFYEAVEGFNQKFLKMPESIKLINGSVDNMITELNSLGVSIPKTRSEFTNLVTSLDLTDKSQSQLYMSLMALSPAVDTVFSSIETLGGGLSESQARVMTYSSSLTSVIQVFSDLGVSVPNSVNEFNSLIQSIDLTSESGQTLYSSLMAATPALNQLYDAAKQIVGIDVSNVGSALQKGIEVGSQGGNAGQAFYSSFIEDVQANFMSSTLNSVSTIIMDSVVTPMINSSVQSATNIQMGSLNAGNTLTVASVQSANNLELSSVNVSNNLATAGVNTANSFLQIGNTLATVGMNLTEAGISTANNLAQAGASASTNLAQGSSYASQEMAAGGNNAGQSLIIAGKLSTEALAETINTVKEVMLVNAQVMDAIKNDTEFAKQMSELGNTIFEGTSSFIASKPEQFSSSYDEPSLPEETNKVVQSQLKTFEKSISSASEDLSASGLELKSSVAEFKPEIEEVVDTLADAREMFNSLQSSTTQILTGAKSDESELKNLEETYANLRLFQRLAGKSSEELAQSLQSISLDSMAFAVRGTDIELKTFISDTQKYLELVKKQEEAEIERQKAIEEYNTGLDEQLKTLSLSEAQLKEINDNKEYQKLIDDTISAGGDLVKAEQINALKMSAIAREQQKAIDEYNQSLDEQLSIISLSDSELKIFNSNKEYQKLIDDTIKAGGDLAKAEQLNAAKKAKIADEQNKAIADFEKQYRDQIQQIGKSSQQLELDQLANEFQSALDQANELGASTILVTESFEQQRADVIKKYADENSEAIKSLQSSVVELSSLKNVSKERQAVSTAQGYGIDFNQLVVGSDIQNIIDEATNYSTQQWVELMQSIGLSIEAANITQFKEDMGNVASVAIQLQSQFGSLKNSLEQITGVSDDSTQKLLGIADQFPEIGIAIDGNTVAIQGMIMTSKEAANELLKVMDNPVEFAKLASKVGFESQEDFINAASSIIGSMKDLDAKTEATESTIKDLHEAMDDIQNPIEGAQKTLIDLDKEFKGFGIASNFFGQSASDVASAVNEIPIDTLERVSAQYGLSVEQLSSKIVSGVQALNQIQGQVATFQQQQQEAIKVANGMSESQLIIDKLKEKYKEFPEIVAAISKKGLTSLDVQKFVTSKSTENFAKISSVTGYSIESILDDVKNLEGALDGVNARSKEVSSASKELKNSLKVMAGETTSTAISVDGFKEKYSVLIQKFGLGNASIETLNKKISSLSDDQFEKIAKMAHVGTTELIADIKAFSEDTKTIADQTADRTSKLAGFISDMDKTASTLDDVEYSMKKLGQTSPELVRYLNTLGKNSYEISASLAKMDTSQMDKLAKVAEGMDYSLDEILEQSKTYIDNLRSQEEAKADLERNSLEEQQRRSEEAFEARRKAQEEQRSAMEKLTQEQQAAYEKQLQEQQAAYEKQQDELMKQVDELFNNFDKLADKIASVSENLASSIKSFYSEAQLDQLNQTKLIGLKGEIYKPRTLVDAANPESTNKILDNIDEYQKLLVDSRKKEIANIEKARDEAQAAHSEELAYYQTLHESALQVTSEITSNIDEIAKTLGQVDDATTIKQRLLDDFANESDFEKKLDLAKQIPMAIKNAMDEEIALDEKRIESAKAAKEAQEKLNESIQRGLTSSANIREKITGQQSDPNSKFKGLMAQISQDMAATEENIKLIEEAQNAAYENYQFQIDSQKKLEDERFNEAKKHLEDERKGVEELRKQSESFLNLVNNFKRQGKTDTKVLELEQTSFKELLAKYQSGDVSSETLDAIRSAGTAYIQQGEKVYGSAKEQTGVGGVIEQVSSAFKEIGLSLDRQANQKEANLPLDETLTGSNVTAIKEIQARAATETINQLAQLDSILNTMRVEPSPLPESQIEAIRMGASEQLNVFNEQMLLLTEQLNPENQPKFDESEFAIRISETQNATVTELQALSQMTMQLDTELKSSLELNLTGIYNRLSPENQMIVAQRLEVAIQRDITAPLRELGITFTTAISGLGSVLNSTFNKVQSDFKSQISAAISSAKSSNTVATTNKLPATTTDAPLITDKETGNLIPLAMPRTVGGLIISAPKMAEGGIVTKPTYAYIGEGGESEAVIPLSKLSDIIQNISISTRSNQSNNNDIQELVKLLTAMSKNGNDKQNSELLIKILDAINKLNSETKNGFKNQQRAIEEKKRI